MRVAGKPHWHQRGLALVLLLVLAHAACGSAALRQVTSEHFAIFYEQDSGAVSKSYLQLVEQGLESAYAFFAIKGFAAFPGLIRVNILSVAEAEGIMGHEYLDRNENGDLVPVIGIAPESVMNGGYGYANTATSLEDLVLSTCAHELFHTIQDYHSLHGSGDMSEESFVEPHATAVQEVVVPSANDYLAPALDFLLAPDSTAFFNRSYDAAIFWVYVLDHFGVRAILDVMASSVVFDGRHAIDHAFAPAGLSFLDVWTHFAVALATGQVPDSNVIATLVRQADSPSLWTKTAGPPPLPPVVFRETWKGTSITAARVNASNAFAYRPPSEDDEIGTSLKVAHAYGIDVLEIVMDRAAPLTIQFNGDASSTFRTTVAYLEGSRWTSLPFTESISLQPTKDVTFIRVIVTRSEGGTGKYSLTIRPKVPGSAKTLDQSG